MDKCEIEKTEDTLSSFYLPKNLCRYIFGVRIFHGDSGGPRNTIINDRPYLNHPISIDTDRLLKDRDGVVTEGVNIKFLIGNRCRLRVVKASSTIDNIDGSSFYINYSTNSLIRKRLYCSDVSVEYDMGKFGPSRISMCNNAHCVERGFNNCYEEVDLNKDVCRDIFDLDAAQKEYFAFFESRNTWALPNNVINQTSPIISEFVSCTNFMREFNPYVDGGEFKFSSPLRTNLQIPMREILSIYIVMFYLGSLVRYRPYYLEEILSSKEAWIIEQFTKSAPITFLRLIRNLMMRQNFIYTTR